MEESYKTLALKCMAVRFEGLDSMQDIFGAIASAQQYIYETTPQVRDMVEYKEQCAYAFVLLIIYLKSANELTDNVLTALDKLDGEKLEVSTPSESITRIMDMHELTGELAGITKNIVAGKLEHVQGYHMRVVVLSLMFMLAIEASLKTGESLYTMVNKFLLTRGTV